MRQLYGQPRPQGALSCFWGAGKATKKRPGDEVAVRRHWVQMKPSRVNVIFPSFDYFKPGTIFENLKR